MRRVCETARSRLLVGFVAGLLLGALLTVAAYAGRTATWEQLQALRLPRPDLHSPATAPLHIATAADAGYTPQQCRRPTLKSYRAPQCCSPPIESVRVACVTHCKKSLEVIRAVAMTWRDFLQSCTPSTKSANGIACTYAPFWRGSPAVISVAVWRGRAGTSLDCRTSSAPSGFGVRSAASRSMTWAWPRTSSRRSRPGAASPSGM